MTEASEPRRLPTPWRVIEKSESFVNGVKEWLFTGRTKWRFRLMRERAFVFVSAVFDNVWHQVESRFSNGGEDWDVARERR